MPFESAFARVALEEGGYTGHPADPGGKTRYGITEAVARANGYQGDMRFLPPDAARRIYRAQYWDLLHLGDVDALAPEIAGKLFDIAVNCGTATAGRFLQRALNALNREASDYPDMPVDGLIGPRTLHALRSFIAVRGGEGIAVLFKAIDGEQTERYIEIAEARPKDEAFEFGWLAKRIG